MVLTPQHQYRLFYLTATFAQNNTASLWSFLVNDNTAYVHDRLVGKHSDTSRLIEII